MNVFGSKRWLKFAIPALVVVLGVGAVFLFVPRSRLAAAWNDTLEWIGLGGAAEEDATTYWCPMDPQIRRDQPGTCPICSMALVPFEGEAGASRDALVLTPEQVQQAGVTYRPALRLPTYREIDTTGRLEYDERNLARITTRVAGWIEELHVDFTYQQVEPNQPLVEIYSPELAAAVEELFTWHRRVQDAPGNERLAEQNRRLFEGAQQRLRNLGVTQDQIEQWLAYPQEDYSVLRLYAQRAGTVIRRHVTEGDHVAEGAVLLEIADLTHLWVYADIYEQDLPLVEEGTPVTLSIRSFPGETFTGTVDFVDREVQRDTRTARARINIPNPDGRLRPGMYARAELRAEFPEMLVVPENAVLWTGERTVVIVRRSQGRFEPREVRLGQRWLYRDFGDSEQGGGASPATGETPVPLATYEQAGLPFGARHQRYHEVLAGLRPGEEVVTNGLFLLNSESQTHGILTKMLPGESESATLEQLVGQSAAEQMRLTLDAYFLLSESLAQDELEPAVEHAQSLAEAADELAAQAADSDQPQLARAARRVREEALALVESPPEDLRAARRGFAQVSEATIAMLREHGAGPLLGREVFAFHCPMADNEQSPSYLFGFDLWLGPTDDLRNPYMGSEMLRCGSQIYTLDPAVEEAPAEQAATEPAAAPATPVHQH